MIKTTAILLKELNDYANPLAKISLMIRKKELFPLIRGLYETDPKVPGHYLASSIYGPSYLSFEFALAHHGLIPETVFKYTSATYHKRRRKMFITPFGVFTYRDVPKRVFSLETRLVQEQGYSYILATPEKAICDLIYTLEPCGNQKEFLSVLFDFYRIDEQQFLALNSTTLIQLANLYKTRNHRHLVAYLSKENKRRGNSASTND